MAKHIENSDSVEREVRRYILGQLTPQQEERLDRLLMADNDEFLQKVGISEEVLHDELIQDYVSEKLSDAERMAFEVRLLPSRKIAEDLMLDRALRVGAGRKNRSVAQCFGAWFHLVLRPAPLAAYTTLLLMVAGWSVYHSGQLQRRLDEAASRQTSLTVAEASLRSQVVKERQNSDTLARELAASASVLAGMKQSFASAGQGIGAVASFILKPGSNRGGGQTTRATIASGQILVELKLDVGIDQYENYRAALYDSSDNEVLVTGKIRAVHVRNSVYVPVQLPVQLLDADDYQVRLSGAAARGKFVPIDSYIFRVVRR